MADSSSPSAYDGQLKDSTGLEIAGKIMVSIMMFLFFTVVLFLFLHLYCKCFSYHRQLDREAHAARRHRRRSRRFEFIAGHPAPAARCRLDPSVLSSIPVIIFSPKDQEMECAVCLSETLEGEKIRILPTCNHGFHVDCIDMWFQSNSTCPICRNSVSIQPEEAQNPAVFPTNVLVWGNQGEVTSLSLNTEEPSSSSSGSPPSNIRADEMAIDIPRQVDEDEEVKSPVIRQLKSLKRLLSMGATRVNPSSSRADPGKMDPEHC